MTDVVVTTGAIRRLKLQSNHHHQQTNTQLHALPVAQQCQSTEGKWGRDSEFFSQTGSPSCRPTNRIDSKCQSTEWNCQFILLHQSDIAVDDKTGWTDPLSSI